MPYPDEEEDPRLAALLQRGNNMQAAPGGNNPMAGLNAQGQPPAYGNSYGQMGPSMGGSSSPWGQSAPRQMPPPMLPPRQGPMGQMGPMGNPYGPPPSPYGGPPPQQMQQPQQPRMMPQRPMPAIQQPMQQGSGGYRSAPMGSPMAPQQQMRPAPNPMDRQNLQRRTQGAGMGTPQAPQPQPMAPQGGMGRRGFGGG